MAMGPFYAAMKTGIAAAQEIRLPRRRLMPMYVAS